MNFDLSNIEKIYENQYLRFINTTPKAQTPTWCVVGIGVEEGNGKVEYNPNVDRIKWIIHRSATTNHTSNDKQMGIPQKSYKGDPCFEFVNNARDKVNNKTQVLEVDLWDATGSNYKAKLSEATVVPEDYNGDELNWNLYFDGDPTDGTVAIESNTPTFTPAASV